MNLPEQMRERVIAFAQSVRKIEEQI